MLASTHADHCPVDQVNGDPVRPGFGPGTCVCRARPRHVSLTIAEVLRPAVRDRPDAPALTGPSGTLSYAGLDRAADAAAGALWRLGVRPGDRGAACLPNDFGIVVAFHGAQRIGAVWAGGNEAYLAAEQQAIVDLVSPAVVLAGPR